YLPVTQGVTGSSPVRTANSASLSRGFFYVDKHFRPAMLRRIFLLSCALFWSKANLFAERRISLEIRIIHKANNDETEKIFLERSGIA
ncbi:MAG: hypothetical protein J6U81_01170, partial [Bacteroidales bacterium]|nr:hypothetical protein [Bacteroidales bacterium]